MHFQISIRSALKVISLVVVTLITALGAGAYLALKKMDVAVHSTDLIQTHMEADMMHDAVRGELMKILYWSTANGKYQAIVANSQIALQENADNLMKNLSIVQQKVDASLKNQVSETILVAKRYIHSANTLASQAVTGPATMTEEMEAFNRDFDGLEQSLGAISEKIVEAAQHNQQEAKAASSQTRMLLAMGVLIAILAVVPLLLWLSARILRPLQNLLQVADGFVRSGCIDRRVPVHSRDEIGQTIVGFNALMDAVERLLSDVGQAATALFKTTALLIDLSEKGRNSALSNNDAATSVATAVEELSSSMSQIAAQSDTAQNASRKSLTLTTESCQEIEQAGQSIQGLAQAMEKSSTQMQTLSSQANSISQISGDIGGIAEQTNLLALNAAIEAARAGNEGRGFAVVADAVRGLAERTAKSTDKISSMIYSIQQDTIQASESIGNNLGLVNKGLAMTSSASGLLGMVKKQSEDATHSVISISMSLKEQNTVIAGLGEVVKVVSLNCKKGVDAAQQISEQTSTLVDLANKLHTRVQNYVVKG